MHTRGKHLPVRLMYAATAEGLMRPSIYHARPNFQSITVHKKCLEVPKFPKVSLLHRDTRLQLQGGGPISKGNSFCSVHSA